MAQFTKWDAASNSLKRHVETTDTLRVYGLGVNQASPGTGLGVTGASVLTGALTQTTGAFSLTGNAASSLSVAGTGDFNIRKTSGTGNINIDNQVAGYNMYLTTAAGGAGSISLYAGGSGSLVLRSNTGSCKVGTYGAGEFQVVTNEGGSPAAKLSISSGGALNTNFTGTSVFASQGGALTFRSTSQNFQLGSYNVNWMAATTYGSTGSLTMISGSGLAAAGSTASWTHSQSGNFTLATSNASSQFQITTNAGGFLLNATNAGQLNFQRSATSRIWTSGSTDATEVLSVRSAGSVDVNAVGADLVLKSNSVAVFTSTPARVLTMASTGASNWSNTSGNLGLSTVTAGSIFINGVGGVNLQSGGVSYLQVAATGNIQIGNTSANLLILTAQVSGDVVFVGGSANPHVVYPAASTGGDTGSALTVQSGASDTGTGGLLLLEGGASPAGTGGGLTIRGGAGTGGTRGLVTIGDAIATSALNLVAAVDSDVVFRVGTNRTVKAEARPTGPTLTGSQLYVRGGIGSTSSGSEVGGSGGGVTVAGGDGGDGSGAFAPGTGGAAYLSGGSGGSGGTGNSNSGGVYVDAGKPQGTGTAGVAQLGTTWASAVTVGNSSATLLLTGSLTTIGQTSAEKLTITAKLNAGVTLDHDNASHSIVGTAPVAGSGEDGDDLQIGLAFGAAGSGATASGIGAALLLLAGQGGNIVSGQTAAGALGGEVTLRAGTGSSTLSGGQHNPATGGESILRGGSGGTNANTSGSYLEGGTGGAARVVGGTGTNGYGANWDGNGGAASLTGGVSGAGSTNSALKGYGGNVTVSGGEGQGVNSGGMARLLGGNSTNTTTSYLGVGGEVQVTGGEAAGGGPGGKVSITGGRTTNAGASGVGGNVEIVGGATGGGGNAGDVKINPGLSTGGGTAGSVYISTAAATNTYIGHASGLLQFFGTGAAAVKQTVTNLTDNTGGTGTDTLDAVEASYTQATIANNFADLARKVNQVIDALQAYGLIG